jgi:Listeria-Bacteroides repeat domain (List_Bact_rpt).
MKRIIIGILALMISMMMWMHRPQVQAYDYRDCEYFILNHFSNTHYTECLKNPYNYAHYFVYYNVTFYSDSTSLRSQSVRRGQNASAPLTPVKVGHTFNGWDRGFTNVQSNLTVNAVWIRSQKVTFLDYNGTVLKEQFVEQGQSATPPSVQARTGYEFTGWNGTYENVTQDASVMATYQAISYQVTFLDDNGDVYQTMTTTYNGFVQPPTPPVVTGKTFTQWSTPTTQVQSNLTVQAMYDTNRYTIRFLDDTDVLKEQLVDHGGDATPPTMSKEGHIFAGWNASYTNVDASIDLIAQWTKEQYDVYFYHPTGELLSHQSVEYMGNATEPVYSPVEGMSFVAWDQPTTQITGTVHLRPIEQIATYNVYFMDGDTLLLSQVIEHAQPCQTFNAVKEGHDFDGWDADCDSVTSDITLRALFTPHQYKVLFYDFLGAVVKEETVNYGQPATAPDTTFPNYRFTGWNESFDHVITDLVVRPLGELRTYQAVFKITRELHFVRASLPTTMLSIVRFQQKLVIHLLVGVNHLRFNKTLQFSRSLHRSYFKLIFMSITCLPKASK